jgi:hypothetical protein
VANTTPTSFRLRRETLDQLDRLAELLTARRREPDELAGLDIGEHRAVTRAEALAVAVSSTLGRMQREQSDAAGSSPYRAAADAARGLLAGLGTGSAVDELLAARREEAAAEEAAATAHESHR